MKKAFIGMLCIFLSNSVFASVPTVLTIQEDVKLKRVLNAAGTPDAQLSGFISAVSGNEYCSIGFFSDENDERNLLKAGTTFEIISEDYNYCEFDSRSNDYFLRKCIYKLSGKKIDESINLTLTCADEGLFAKKISLSKINKMLENKANLK